MKSVSNIPLYAHSYLVATPQGYTKHYYAGDQRIGSKIGTGGFGSGFAGNNSTLSGNATDLFYYMTQEYIKNFDESESWQQETEDVEGNCYITSLSGAYESEMNTNVFAVPRIVSFAVELKASILGNLAGYATNQGPEREVYFFHSDHLGGASWITNASGAPVQHLRYAPFGDPLVNQRSSNYNERFTFTGKERDEETGYYYHGARFHWPAIGFLSVDPKADEQPWQSPYIYCSNNPITRIDPTGMLDGWYVGENGTVIGRDKNNDDKVYLVYGSDATKVKADNYEKGVAQSNLNDPVEMPSLDQREMLKDLYDYGNGNNHNEHGALIYTNPETNENVALFYKSATDITKVDGNIDGSLKFQSKEKIGEKGNTAIFPNELSVIGHTHNLKDGMAHPPTLGGDRLFGGAKIGVVFDYPTGGSNAYIYNANTRFRTKAVMKSSVFLSPFITPTGKKL